MEGLGATGETLVIVFGVHVVSAMILPLNVLAIGISFVLSNKFHFPVA
jgi:hypothetical protein